MGVSVSSGVSCLTSAACLCRWRKLRWCHRARPRPTLTPYPVLWARMIVPQETLEDEGMARNDIRDAVRSFFPKRDCFTLVRPVSDEEKLADLSKIPYTDLRDEFRHGVRTATTAVCQASLHPTATAASSHGNASPLLAGGLLRALPGAPAAQIEAMKRRLFSALEVKSVYGRPLNGAMLCSLAQAYVSALNSSGTPTISTAWERVVASQCEVRCHAWHCTAPALALLVPAPGWRADLRACE